MPAVGLAAALCLALAPAVGGCGSSGSSSASTSSSATSTAKEEAGGGNQAKEGAGDSSIQGYGGAAKGSEKAEVAAAAHGFFAAMAARDYAGMCEALAGSNREQLQAFGEGGGGGGGGGGCAGALKKLLNPNVAAEAHAAAAAQITSVRIKGGNAFALFTPKGGAESYFVMKREGDSWKAISVTPGTPLEPTASP